MREVFKCHAEIFPLAGRININVVWDSPKVDRPRVYGFNFSERQIELVKRIKKAINTGAMFYDMSVQTDRQGKTYVIATTRVLGGTADADLKRLGY
jgi:hypothetical protein